MLAPLRSFSRNLARIGAIRTPVSSRFFSTVKDSADAQEAPKAEGADAKAPEAEAPFVIDEAEVQRLRDVIAKASENHADFAARLVREKEKVGHLAQRYAKEIDAESKYGIQKYAAAMVEIADTLEGALRHTDEEKFAKEDIATIVAGFESTQKLLKTRVDSFQQ